MGHVSTTVNSIRYVTTTFTKRGSMSVQQETSYVTSPQHSRSMGHVIQSINTVRYVTTIFAKRGSFQCNFCQAWVMSCEELRDGPGRFNESFPARSSYRSGGGQLKRTSSTPQWLSELRRLWTNKLVFLIGSHSVPWQHNQPTLTSLGQGYMVFRCNLPPALLVE